MNKTELKTKIAELCSLENRDRTYLPTNMRVGNEWNASLEGFFSDGLAIVYCQSSETDWDDCATIDQLLGNGFVINSRGMRVAFDKEQCEKFLANFASYYARQTEPKQKELLLLHKEHDTELRMDFNNVVNHWYDRLRLNNLYDRTSSNPRYRKYKAIESAVSNDWKEHFVELCGMASKERVQRWERVAEETANGKY